MTMKKIVIPAIIAMVAVFATGMLFGYLFDFLIPSLKAQYENSTIFRSWSDPLMMIYFIYPLLISLALAWIWDKVKSILQGNYMRRVLNFTGMFFLVSVIPGMIMSLSSFKISVVMVITWTISSYFQVLVATLIFGKMNK